MEAMYTAPVTVGSPAGTTFRNAARNAVRAIAAVLAEGVRGEEFSSRFTTPSSAHFAALPRSEQGRQLDRGYRQ